MEWLRDPFCCLEEDGDSFYAFIVEGENQRKVDKGHTIKICEGLFVWDMSNDCPTLYFL